MIQEHRECQWNNYLWRCNNLFFISNTDLYQRPCILWFAPAPDLLHVFQMIHGCMGDAHGINIRRMYMTLVKQYLFYILFYYFVGQRKNYCRDSYSWHSIINCYWYFSLLFYVVFRLDFVYILEVWMLSWARTAKHVFEQPLYHDEGIYSLIAEYSYIDRW